MLLIFVRQFIADKKIATLQNPGVPKGRAGILIRGRQESKGFLVGFADFRFQIKNLEAEPQQ